APAERINIELAFDLFYAGFEPAAKTAVFVEKPDFPPLSIVTDEVGTLNRLRVVENELQIGVPEPPENSPQPEAEFCPQVDLFLSRVLLLAFGRRKSGQRQRERQHRRHQKPRSPQPHKKTFRFGRIELESRTSSPFFVHFARLVQPSFCFILPGLQTLLWTGTAHERTPSSHSAVAIRSTVRHQPERRVPS